MNSTPVRPEVWDRPFVKKHRTWCSDLVLELRLQGQPGPTIGDRLAEVEGHCAETGESPEEGFGSAREYARQLAAPGVSGQESGVWKITILAAVHALALVIGVAALTSWARDERVTYNAVQLLCLGLFLVLLLGLPKFLPAIVRHPLAFGGLLFVAILASVGATTAGGADLPVVLTLPAAAVAVVLFLVVLTFSYLEYRELSGSVDEELVTSPLAPSVPSAPSRSSRWMVLAPVLAVPVTYCLLALFTFTFA